MEIIEGFNAKYSAIKEKTPLTGWINSSFNIDNVPSPNVIIELNNLLNIIFPPLIWQ